MTTRRPTDPEPLREAVRENYARIARTQSDCCQTSSGSGAPSPEETGLRIGYAPEQLQALPDSANLGLGCGNPTAIAALEPGQVVLDLGSGAGIDVFLASRRVGPSGRVIGVDMTDDMLALARRNAAEGGYDNVEFRKGLIEDLPVADASIDVILSNCVVNLSPEKDRVFAEAWRVLRPGGRLQISDLALARPLPAPILQSLEAWVGCIGGGLTIDQYPRLVEAAGFRDVEVRVKGSFASMASPEDPQVRAAMAQYGLTFEAVRDILDTVLSVEVVAVR